MEADNLMIEKWSKGENFWEDYDQWQRLQMLIGLSLEIYTSWSASSDTELVENIIFHSPISA